LRISSTLVALVAALLSDIPITYIAPTVEANQKFFGIAHWPDDPGVANLGNRIIRDPRTKRHSSAPRNNNSITCGTSLSPRNPALPGIGCPSRQTCVNCVEGLEYCCIQGEILSHSICLKVDPWCAMGTASTGVLRCSSVTLE
jgi:hypothetical protein